MRTRTAPIVPAAALVALGLAACTFDEPAHENLHEGERDPLLEELDEPQDNDYFGRAAPDETPLDTSVAAPLDATGEIESVWVYLAARYDTDGDGRITTAEYDREGGSWDRLDRNEDGAIDATDFESSLRMMPGAADMRRVRAQGVVAWYWQADDDPDRLVPAELDLALAAFDANADGAVERAEHEAAAADRSAFGRAPEGRIERSLADADVWEVLVVAVDTDADGRVTGTEVAAFFAALDDGDGVWSLAPRARTAAAGGHLEGQPAPDFTLPTDRCEGTVTLSSFRGDRPVALVFGSYT